MARTRAQKQEYRLVRGRDVVVTSSVDRKVALEFDGYRLDSGVTVEEVAGESGGVDPAKDKPQKR